MTKIQCSCLAFFILLISASNTTIENKKVAFDNYKVECKLKDGKFDGQYVSYYLNGIKKAQGQFVANQRKGKWSVWDASGNLVASREYVNDYQFKQLLPGQAGSKVNVPLYSLIRNEAGYFSYYNFNQKDIVVSKRTWREAGTNDNVSFFGNDDFFHALVDSITKGKIRLYDFKSDELTTLISNENLKTMLDTVHKEIIGFKIKEDWFYDNIRKTSEKRIISICPIVCKKDEFATEDDFSYEMGWLYFPELRNTLSAIKVNDYGTTIQNLDDLFFFRCFSSVVYKETNVKNLELREYISPGKLADEQFKIEIDLLEREHELWVKN